MSEILLVRHGETSWNAAGRVQGWAPVGLNAAGRRQARRLARHLTAEHEDGNVTLVTSDLARARETAAPIAAAFDVEPTTDSRLRERDFGRYQGLDSTDLFDRFPELDLLAEGSDAATYTPDSGESWISVRDRVLAAVADLRERARSDDCTVIAVTHHNPIRLAFGRLRDLDLTTALTRHSFENGSITRIRDGRIDLAGHVPSPSDSG
ncbi:histidine phosphatase family protein [Halopenitus sp. POP-27]|uniref:histidine phosphatase family protein n=1 Tax=Halopenitus sp. POP-27 TaxID=2994425 RepID=UPI0024684F8D|nr:histidine phosphatase family protein [Halopenitus sp. POP-27]